MLLNLKFVRDGERKSVVTDVEGLSEGASHDEAFNAISRNETVRSMKRAGYAVSGYEVVEDLDESSNSKQGRWAHLIHDSDFRVTHAVHFMGKKIGEVHQTGTGNQYRPVYHPDNHHPDKGGPKKSLDLAPSVEHAIEAIKKHHKKVWVPYGNDDK